MTCVASIWLATTSWALRSLSGAGMLMIRSGAGISITPVAAPHQSSRRSRMISLGEVRTTVQAPVPTGQPFSVSRKVKLALSSTSAQMCSGSQISPWPK